MDYKVIKKNVGKKNASIFSTFETEKEIIDTSFHEETGIMFIERGNPSISLIDLKGKVTRNWLGENGDPRRQNGSQYIARLKNPCSICNNGVFGYIIEESGYVIRSFDLKNRHMESYSGKMYKEDLGKHLFNKKKPPVIKSTANENGIFFVNDIVNKVFCMSYGNLDRVIGDGKARYSVSSDYQRSSFNSPSGIFVDGADIYVSDTNNHCVRRIGDNSIRIVVGSPLENDISEQCLLNPSKLVIKRNMIFVLDGNKVKVTGVSARNTSNVYESDTIDSLEADNRRNIYIMERQNG